MNVEILLNTLLAERYARRALLSELIDELGVMPSQCVATRAARSLLRSLEDEPPEQGVYEMHILHIGQLAQDAMKERPPQDGGS